VRVRFDDLAHATTEVARLDKLAVALARAKMASRASVSHYDVFNGVGDFQWLWLNTVGSRRLGFVKDLLPSLPDAKTQKNFVGRSGDSALWDGFNIYRTWKSMAAKHGRPLGRDSKVLDFGCGWGRIYRFFLREVAPGNLFGVDVMPRALELSRSTNPWGQFSQVPSVPPSTLPSNHFDVVYLYSVFSHLSEEAHDKWLTEFRRILKPGGLLMASTRPREYIVVCDQNRRRGGDLLHDGAFAAFAQTDEWLERYDRGEYCYSGTGGGDVLDPKFYGEACIPEAYVRRRWTDRFEFLEYLPYGRRLRQDAIVVRKPLSG
jgi:SAM-dependent methyltransferase